MTMVEAPASERAADGEPLKIDVVVHGRFHGFALSRALIGLGHDVRVLTNYPKTIVRRFGVEPPFVRSCIRHGVLARVAHRLGAGALEPHLHRYFGRWAARHVRPDADLVYGFSGVMKEFLESPRRQPHQMRVMVRGSSHIREQARLLAEEQARVGVAIEAPKPWIVAREEREYALADAIVVLSNFAKQSFVRQGVPEDKIFVNPLGVDTKQFECPPQARTERERRILSGAPLRVLTVGTFSYRKGVRDLIEAAQALGDRMNFVFVGDTPPETEDLRKTVGGAIEMVPRVAERDLARHYHQADLFLFQTIEDGFAAVLLQAAAAGLPILATTNCSAPDFVVEGETGWILNIRDPAAVAARLRWCDENRLALAAMLGETSKTSTRRDWRTMARELVLFYRQASRSRLSEAS